MTAAINKDLIDLQQAHVTQFTTESGAKKGPWLVRQNITSKDLAELPSYLSEADVFTILDFARKYELLAFNIGIDFGKKKTVKVYKTLLDRLELKLKMATEENERLAGILDKHIGE